MNYIHNQDDYAVEPMRGLPARLPRGEFVLWQGAPSWRVFARQVFHTRTIGALVVLGALARAGLGLNAGASLGTALGESGVILAFGTVGLAILWLLAFLVERTTVYTITNKRIMMRVGVAIQKTFNVPFATIDGAALRMHGPDAGNLSVALKPDVSLAYLIMWPHVRPWRMSKTEPTLRAIPKAQAVARLLTDAFTSHAQTNDALARSAISASLNANAADTDARNSSEPVGQQKLNDPHYIPKPLVIAAAAAAVLTVLVVGFAQITGAPGQRTGSGEVLFSQDILFEPLTGDRIAVQDTQSGQTLTTLEAGTDGLLRSALRGLGNSRDQSNLDLDAPYQLQNLAGDGVYLVDPSTGRSIRLDSFGPLDSGATADLLRLGRTVSSN